MKHPSFSMKILNSFYDSLTYNQNYLLKSTIYLMIIFIELKMATEARFWYVTEKELLILRHT